MGDHKKISFGFSKVIKKPNTKFVKEERNIQLIDSLENQAIKPKIQCLQEKKKPLVIPMPQSSINESIVQNRLVTRGKAVKLDGELTEDEIAARELIKDALNLKEGRENPKITLPQITSYPNIGESTIENYEAVPIEQFGLALLKGMNWKDGDGIGQNNRKQKVEVKEPPLRVNRMALGADKSLLSKRNHEPENTEKHELKVKIGSYVKIVDGKHKGKYCEVQGFDDDPERIIVKMSPSKIVLSMIKYYIKPVSKEEYSKFAKVLNIDKYEEYVRLNRDSHGSKKRHQEKDE